jgi:hypothetical protein
MWLEIESIPSRRWKTWIFNKPKFLGFNYDPGTRTLYVAYNENELVFRRLDTKRVAKEQDLKYLIKLIFRKKLSFAS